MKKQIYEIKKVATIKMTVLLGLGLTAIIVSFVMMMLFMFICIIPRYETNDGIINLLLYGCGVSLSAVFAMWARDLFYIPAVFKSEEIREECLEKVRRLRNKR